MRYYLRFGLIVFAAAKVCFFLPTLLIAEWCRRRSPRLITGALRLVIVLYIGIYTVGVFALNHISAGRRDDSGPRNGIGMQASLEKVPALRSVRSAE